jgi:hypothetical protein
MLFTCLNTERLLLKNIAEDDKEFIFSQFSNDSVNRHLFDAEPMKGYCRGGGTDPFLQDAGAAGAAPLDPCPKRGRRENRNLRISLL